MYNLILPVAPVLIGDLDAAMRIQFSERISGLSSNDTDLRIHFYEPFDTQDEIDAQAIVDAHDPVFITAERDGDIITLTLDKPRNIDEVSELTPSWDGESAVVPATLINNAVTVTVDSPDEITIGIVDNYPHNEVTI